MAKMVRTGTKCCRVAGLGATVRGWRRSEMGMSDIVSAIFVLPFIAFLIFALVDTGVNLRYRTLVDNATQSVVRSISQDGGLYWSRTTQTQFITDPVTGVPYGVYDPTFRWDVYGTKILRNLCGAGAQRCTSINEAKMTCTVAGGTSGYGWGIQVAPGKGALVECRSVFPYLPVSPLSKNLVTSVGFNTLLTSPIQTSVRGITTTGLGG